MTVSLYWQGINIPVLACFSFPNNQFTCRKTRIWNVPFWFNNQGRVMCTRSLVEKLIRSLQQGLQREDTLIGWSECLSLVKIDWMNDWLMCGKATKRAVLLQKGTNCPLCKSYPTMSDTLNRELGKVAIAKIWLIFISRCELACSYTYMRKQLYSSVLSTIL